MRRLLVCLLTMFLAASTAYAIDAEDVKLPPTMKAGDTELVLNGQGLRTKKVVMVTIKGYMGGLYLTQKSTNAQAIIDADEPMALKLFITSGLISSKVMTEATNEGFEKATNNNTAALRTRIDKMLEIFSDKIQQEDVYDLVYVPGAGTEIYKNGKKSATVEGMDFKKALFGIWLSDNCVLESLKNGMLGL